MNQSPEERKCDCEEISCKEGCLSGHTHKTFWCEKCHPERHEGQVVEDAQERPWHEAWIDKNSSDAGDIMDDSRVITIALAKEVVAESNRRIAERIKFIGEHHVGVDETCARLIIEALDLEAAEEAIINNQKGDE